MRAKDGSECWLSVRWGALVKVLDFRKIDIFCELPLKCVIWFSPSINCWKGHVDPRLLWFNVYRWTKDMDRWIVVDNAQSHQGITQSKVARAPFFSSLIGLHENALQLFLTPNYYNSLILALALFYYIQPLSYGTFTHSNALFHAGAYIQLAFFTRISNRYQVWSLCIVYNASYYDKSSIGK
jgi:hypothetical protein